MKHYTDAIVLEGTTINGGKHNISPDTTKLHNVQVSRCNRIVRDGYKLREKQNFTSYDKLALTLAVFICNRIVRNIPIHSIKIY